MSKLVRFDPFAEMDALQRHFFNDDNWMPRQVRSVGLPTTDVYMKDNALVVEVHLPKFDEDDVNISVENGNLVIQAQRHEKEEDKEKKYVVRESSSSFYRSVQLPERADASARAKENYRQITRQEERVSLSQLWPSRRPRDYPRPFANNEIPQSS